MGPLTTPTKFYPYGNKRLQPIISEINIQNQPFSRATWVETSISTLKLLVFNLSVHLTLINFYKGKLLPLGKIYSSSSSVQVKVMLIQQSLLTIT